MMNSTDPIVKLMFIRKALEKVREIVSKETLNEVDVKLLKGIYFKNTSHKIPKKEPLEIFFDEE